MSIFPPHSCVLLPASAATASATPTTYLRKCCIGVPNTQGFALLVSCCCCSPPGATTAASGRTPACPSRPTGRPQLSTRGWEGIVAVWQMRVAGKATHSLSTALTCSQASGRVVVQDPCPSGAQSLFRRLLYCCCCARWLAATANAVCWCCCRCNVLLLLLMRRVAAVAGAACCCCCWCGVLLLLLMRRVAAVARLQVLQARDQGS